MGKRISLGITFDADTGEVIEVGTVDGKIIEIPKGVNRGVIGNLQLNGLTQNPSVVITSHSSPGCVTYIVNGHYYRV